MKRVSIFLLIVAMLNTASCTSFTRKLELKTDVDSLSYFYGLSRSDGIMGYLTMQAGVDTAYMSAFYKGFKDGMKNYSPKDIAYVEGLRLAQLINIQWINGLNNEIFMGDSIQSVNRKAMLTGFYQGVKHADNLIIMQAQSYSQIKMEVIKDNYKKIKFAEAIATGEKFLIENKNKTGVITTETGLQYKILIAGVGDTPDERSIVKLNYRGALIDGAEFDSSYKNGAPASFYTTQVIRGWTEALMLMPVGSKWELYIPYDLAYGSAGLPPEIPPYSTLIIEVELVGIESN